MYMQYRDRLRNEHYNQDRIDIVLRVCTLSESYRDRVSDVEDYRYHIEIA